jgi:hypothetical protein
MATTNAQEQECCPKFIPEPWDDRIIEWENKKFIKDHVRTFFFMPLNFGKVMKRVFGKLSGAGATVPENLGLSDHTSRWNMDLYIAVDKDVPGAENTILSGKFYSRVYEGPFRDTDKWCRDFKEKAGAKGMDVKKWFMWYTTCPKCAKKYGKNYVAIISKVSSN